jgi:hypothetical protein
LAVVVVCATAPAAVVAAGLAEAGGVVVPGAVVPFAVAPAVPGAEEAGAAAAVDDPCFFLEPWVGGVVDAVAGGVVSGSAAAFLPPAFLLFGAVESEAVLVDVGADVFSVAAVADAAPVEDVPAAAVVLVP